MQLFFLLILHKEHRGQESYILISFRGNHLWPVASQVRAVLLHTSQATQSQDSLTK